MLANYYQDKPRPKLRESHPNLTEDGAFTVSDLPSATQQAEFRPPNLAQQVIRLTGGVMKNGSWVLPDDDLADDDFGDYMDDLPDEGYTQAELDAMPEASKSARESRQEDIEDLLYNRAEKAEKRQFWRSKKKEATTPAKGGETPSKKKDTPGSNPIEREGVSGDDE